MRFHWHGFHVGDRTVGRIRQLYRVGYIQLVSACLQRLDLLECASDDGID